MLLLVRGWCLLFLRAGPVVLASLVVFFAQQLLFLVGVGVGTSWGMLGVCFSCCFFFFFFFLLFLLFVLLVGVVFLVLLVPPSCLLVLLFLFLLLLVVLLLPAVGAPPPPPPCSSPWWPVLTWCFVVLPRHQTPAAIISLLLLFA